MDNSTIISTISTIFGIVFWILIFYFIIRLFRAAIKKKPAARTESPRPVETAKEEIKETAEEAVKPRSGLSKILRWRATTWKGKLLVALTAMILVPVLLAIFLPDDDYQTDTAEPKSEAETYYVKTSAANVRDFLAKFSALILKTRNSCFRENFLINFPTGLKLLFRTGVSAT